MNDPNAAAMYRRMSEELAAYQGAPRREPVGVGDMNGPSFVPTAHSPDAGGDRELAQTYRDLDGREGATMSIGKGTLGADDIAAMGMPPVDGREVPVPKIVEDPRIPPPTGLAESIPTAGGVLIPPVTR